MQSVEEKLQKLQLQPAPPAPPPPPPPPPAVGDVDKRSARKRDKKYRKTLRIKHQRLLLLHHAAKCPEEEGHCRVTPHCANMKELWKHIAECKDQKCVVQHCISSRYVLSHYRRCKDDRCPICGPVRRVVHSRAPRIPVEPSKPSEQL